MTDDAKTRDVPAKTEDAPADDDAAEQQAPAEQTAPADVAGAELDDGPVEDLTAGEVAFSLSELQTEVDKRRGQLQEMPDGPRPAAPRGSYKRRNFMVDLPLQLSYVGVYIATLTLLTVGFIALNFLFKALYDRALQIQQHATRLTDSPDLLMLALINFSFVMLLLIGMAVYAIIQSHRVAGPAYRFKRALGQMHRRDYDWHLILRNKDFMHDLAEQVNVLNNALKAKDVVIANATLRLAKLSAGAEGETAEQLQEVATDLSDVLLPIPGAEDDA